MDFNAKTKKIILIWDVTFLQKSYSEYTQVDKPVVVTTSYEKSNEEEEPQTPSLYLKNPRPLPKPETIPMQTLMQNGKKGSKANLPT